MRDPCCQAQLHENASRRSSDEKEEHKAERAAVSAATSAELLAERSATIQKLMSERTALKYQLENETRRRVSIEALQVPSKDALRIDVPNGTSPILFHPNPPRTAQVALCRMK